MLDQLTPEDKTIIISLPYRVGYWVSTIDLDGAESDLVELRTLNNILDGLNNNVFGSEFLQHVMGAMMAVSDDWAEWNKLNDKVLEDCEKAMMVLSGLEDPKERNVYQTRLIEIGEAVALAFQEVEIKGFLGNVKAKSSYKKAKAKAKMMGHDSYKTFHEFLSISGKERQALESLAKALGTSYV